MTMLISAQGIIRPDFALQLICTYTAYCNGFSHKLTLLNRNKLATKYYLYLNIKLNYLVFLQYNANLFQFI